MQKQFFGGIEDSVMTIPRPIPKDLMKRLLLKVLHDIEQPDSPLSGCSSQDKTIISDWLPRRVLGINRLEDQEIINANQAFDELRFSGFITQSPRTQAANVFVLTETGRMEAQKSIEQMRLLTIRIEDVLTRSDILNKVRGDYYGGDYDSAIFKAFRMLEEAVRGKTGEPANVIGVTLMTAAFRSGGRLSHPGVQVDSEREALHQLMRGAIGWFKNPGSHRTVGYDDSRHTAQILAFANVLLDMVDQCTAN